MNSVQIIHLPPSEWQAYRAIRLQSLVEDPQAYSSTYEEVSREPESGWQERLEKATRGDGQWLVFAKFENQLIGMMGAYIADNKSIAIVISAFVAKQFRRRGIGKKLMQALLDEIRKNKVIAKTSLRVSEDELPAIRLYESCGFIITGGLEKKLGDSKEHGIVTMERVL